MRIEVPKNLSPIKAVNFANFIGQCSEEEEFIYDFHQMQNCHPYGLLVIASAIRNNKRRFAKSKHILENIEETQGGRFAASFGFYQSIGYDVGSAKEEDEIGDRYIPIKKISANDLHKEYTDTTLLNEKVNRQSYTLADMLVSDQSQKVRDAIQYCFREIIRNTFEHGETDELWVCGQYWPSRDEAEIAILDEGIGIFRSLHSNQRITVRNCEEANALALQPGLSRMIGMKQNPLDVWQNSGYGLYVASTLCAINGGYFIISSGDSAILISNGGQTNYTANQLGTAICLNIHTNSKKLNNFDETLSAIVKEGEKKALENGEKRILTASKITTIASMIRHIESSVQPDAVDMVELDTLIPLNTEVSFEAKSDNVKGEILGIFEYKGKVFEGILLNVSSFNRKQYIQNSTSINVLVRKPKNGVYTLIEKHKYKPRNL